mmetsp:Transcript_35213/g.85330  ORF Transcript_35213/g.85330 Transcript_35213/m.85330 type:complete len:646 (+) Transcript_35213:75-2012(+)
MMHSQDDGFLSLQSVNLIPTTTLNEQNTTTDHHHHHQLSAIAPLKGNLHKICFQKKRLRASLKHWINSKVGSAKCVSSHDAYLERARADGYFPTTTTTTSAENEDQDTETLDPAVPDRHLLLNAKGIHHFADTTCIDPDKNFLDVYHDGVLYLGAIFDNHDAISPNNLLNDNDDSVTLLQCAVRLYRHLLWRKTFLDQLDATTAYGFVVTCGRGVPGSDGSGSDHYYLVSHKLQMDLSSAASAIGSKVPVQVESHCARISASDSSQSGAAALELLKDLASFLLTPRRRHSSIEVEKVTSHDNHLSNSTTFLYPGPAMLLPIDLRQRLQQQEEVEEERSDSSPPSPRYKVFPTITGSLVIRCINLAAVNELVPQIDLPPINNDDDTNDPLLAASTADDASSWYIKCKTPLLYGPFWETSKVAITGTRRRLQHLLLEQQQRKKHHGLSDNKQQEFQVAMDWLYMHPFDAIHESHKNVVVVRDMGNVFRGQLCWKDFVVAFQSLLEDTVILQDMVQLVHGDIHAGNILLYYYKKPSKQEEPKLILVDWDEAAREKPFHRNTPTEQEKRQYPAALVHFPDLYTKYQFQELFEYYIQKYYYYHTETGDADSWQRFQQEHVASIEEQGFKATVRHRHKMLSAFLHLHPTET